MAGCALNTHVYGITTLPTINNWSWRYKILAVSKRQKHHILQKLLNRCCSNMLALASKIMNFELDFKGYRKRNLGT